MTNHTLPPSLAQYRLRLCALISEFRKLPLPELRAPDDPIQLLALFDELIAADLVACGLTGGVPVATFRHSGRQLELHSEGFVGITRALGSAALGRGLHDGEIRKLVEVLEHECFWGGAFWKQVS